MTNNQDTPSDQQGQPIDYAKQGYDQNNNSADRMNTQASDGGQYQGQQYPSLWEANSRVDILSNNSKVDIPSNNSRVDIPSNNSKVATLNNNSNNMEDNLTLNNNNKVANIRVLLQVAIREILCTLTTRW
eukprot:CAMPEP_0114582682 /NCGR_PEP_ID=MMETSP0125-20121206/6604_1 /TAXON_ID=485358 ORGANISM="Aristerostoma sp., Strain ATCC 50986" /NCGR_SAMPLE_ID=MMETSP0125 /ASSEMBLY_ACC=CAM_ASM_000245 /LENGTH=129 /DNA_ID=CAMNT_0001775761 /DNA_START=93 /DNA_END=480 /DNA_ORIENTATION=-